ncbi:uncharacterized protein AMSG_09839 [Thecamonas trahens ATCC 50062]|uniref:Uncharacterized protein n=1 Tax=Thecamonas trahens ATCC 50062 TaxID=461836 RepID=A0A0L0DPC5_THETB|nr:hypothetical protein AMSG_09839 [Thecamonas trahens ATCC 50062]KNC53881.1 hypothetical protein AMSG_09839 [Thecamonas trahens ATCC 50062]|eukprot:XP_013754257.1 hypothetical protein AMSG_09839 [Thecamonas trahens ATCC 50062]
MATTDAVYTAFTHALTTLQPQSFAFAHTSPLPAGELASLSADQLFAIDSSTATLTLPFWTIPLLAEGAASRLRVDDDHDAVLASMVAVVINADNATAWNVRRRLISAGVLKRDVEVTDVLDMVFRKHPKSSEAWAYRWWLVKELLEDDDARVAELGACLTYADLYPRNYYCWSHARRVCRGLAVRASAMAMVAGYVADGRFHDTSALHLLDELLADDADTATLAAALDRAWLWLDDAPRHESLWMHVRFLASAAARLGAVDVVADAVAGVAARAEARGAACAG